MSGLKLPKRGEAARMLADLNAEHAVEAAPPPPREVASNLDSEHASNVVSNIASDVGSNLVGERPSHVAGETAREAARPLPDEPAAARPAPASPTATSAAVKSLEKSIEAMAATPLGQLNIRVPSGLSDWLDEEAHRGRKQGVTKQGLVTQALKEFILRRLEEEQQQAGGAQ